jgi:FdhE protein
VRQGGAPPTGKWIGSPVGGVKEPAALVVPKSAERFAATAARLEALSQGHSMAGWLQFMAELARAQHAAATTLEPFADLQQREIDHAVAARLPPIAADGHRRDPAWRDGLALMLAALRRGSLSERVTTSINALGSRDDEALESLANDFLGGSVNPGDVSAALFIAAALQVYFTRVAAGLEASALRLLPERGLCPCCGSTPVTGLITASGAVPGTRYLYCSLCGVAWNYVRAMCITCGDARTLSLKGIEGDPGLVKAETCDACRTYAKMLYQTKDMQADPYADDLATLALDVMVAEAGWSRHAPNPLLLVG